MFNELFNYIIFELPNKEIFTVAAELTLDKFISINSIIFTHTDIQELLANDNASEILYKIIKSYNDEALSLTSDHVS